jgi:hypothetical protein
MTERARRLWAGVEADAIGYGGVAGVAAATGLAISTVRKGRDEARAGSTLEISRVRRPGAGRRRLETKDPDLKASLDKLVDPVTRGDPMSPLRWTAKSTQTLAHELTQAGHPVSADKVALLLREGGYTLQANFKTKEGSGHPDRNAQFELISGRATDFMARGVPVISVDGKKKESIGQYGNGGREWQPKGQAVQVLSHDFPDPKMRKAVPYGVYDIAGNTGYVRVGIDHDTPHFAVRAIATWWQSMGSLRYPGARELFITADCGGSNSSRSHAWKAELQKFADRQQLTVHVSHFPPGTSKWNKIEHKLFAFISINWRGRPLTTYETVVSLISATTTTAGLKVAAELDRDNYPLNKSVEPHIMKWLSLERDPFHGEWNYTLRPRTDADLERAGREPPRKRYVPKRPYWEALVREQETSGLNSTQFCLRRGGINYDTFIWWRRILRGRLRPAKNVG